MRLMLLQLTFVAVIVSLRIISVDVVVDSNVVVIETSLPEANATAAKFCVRFAISGLECQNKVYKLIMSKATAMMQDTKTKTLVLAMREHTAQQDVRQFCTQNQLSATLCEDVLGMLPPFFVQRKEQCSTWDRNQTNIVFTTVPKSGTTIMLLLMR
jgi:hypothetical protein